MKPKLIIFDCFGTLLKIDSFSPYDNFLKAIGLNIRDYYKKLMTEKDIDWFSLVNKENITLNDFQKIYSEFQSALYLDNRSVIPYLDNIEEILSHLRQESIVVLLSNLGQGYEVKIEEYLTPYMDKCFYSFEIGTVKPELEAYNLVKNWYIQHYGIIESTDILLVDDKIRNIKAIQAMGMKGLLVNNEHLHSSFSIKAITDLN